MRRVIVGLFLAGLLVPSAWAQTGKHLAVGVGLSVHKYADGSFHETNPRPSFEYRITLKPGVSDGWHWGPIGALGWFSADNDMPVGGVTTRIGRIQVRPLMGGVERTYRQGPLHLGFSVAGGPSFNHFSVDGAARAAYLGLGQPLSGIDVHTSIAIRPEVGLWYDLGKWFALHGSVSYMMNRITADTTAGGVTTSMKWNTDHAKATIGLVVGVF